MRLRDLALCLVGLFSARPAFAAAPADAWWDASYAYRRQILIPAGSAALPAEYAVSVVIDDAQIDPLLYQTDGDDVRIVRYHAGTWSEIERFIDPDNGWNAPSTKVWFSTSTTIARNTTDDNYYIYYGNASAVAPASNPHNIFLLFDDFSAAAIDTSRWSPSGAPRLVTGTDGVRYAEISVDESLRAKTGFDVNTIWEARISLPDRLPGGGKKFFNYWLASSGSNLDGAHTGFYANTSDHYAINHSSSATTQAAIDEGSPIQWQVFSFARDGASTVRFKVNSAEVATLTSNAPVGSLYAYMHNNANGSRLQNYDWIRVRPYRNPEPELSLSAQEQRVRPPIARYSFEETAWTGAANEVRNSASNALHGVRAASANTASVAPAIDGAAGTCRYASLKGAGDYIRIPHAASLNATKEFSVAAWIRHRSASYRDWETILAKGDNSYRLHLNGGCNRPGTLPGNVRYGVTFGLNGGCATADLNSNIVPAQDAWRHVAATFDGARMRLYVDGAQVNDVAYAAAIGTNNLELRIGDNAQQSGRFWNGDIDEVVIWDQAVSLETINQYRKPKDPCTTAAPRIVIEHDGYGVHCAIKPVAVRVLDAANNAHLSYAQNITLDTQRGAGVWSILSGPGQVQDIGQGRATYQWVAGQSQVTFGLFYPKGPAAVDIDVYESANQAIRDDDAEPDLVFAPSRFLLNAPSPQTAGIPFAVQIRAFGQTPDDPQCGVIESYTGDKLLKLWSRYVNPGTGSQAVVVDNVDIPRSEGATRTVRFDQGVATLSVNYRDVGRIGIDAKDDNSRPVAISGGGAVLVKPHRFMLSNIRTSSAPSIANPAAADANGPVFVAAGAPFSVTVSSLEAGGARTPNFGRETPAQGVALTASLIAPAGGSPGVLTAAAGFGPFTGGDATGVDFSFSEVGVITLTPEVRGGGYIDAGVQVAGVASGAVGRFVPADFAVTPNIPSFATACPAGRFTYAGQPFGFAVAPVLTVTARNALGAVTSNYTGAFMKLTSAALGAESYDEATAHPLNMPTPLPPVSIADLGAGRATLTFSSGAGISLSRANTPVAPFDPQIRLTVHVRDEDHVTYGANPFTFGASGGIAFDQGAEQRYGRLAFRNAVGSELLNLPVPMRTEFFASDSAGFVLNTADSCTNSVALELIDVPGDLQSSETCAADPSGNSTIACSGAVSLLPAQQPYQAPPIAGDFSLILRAPGAGNNGAVRVRAAVPSWLQYDWDASSATLEDPTGLANFGLFQGHSRRIYQREVVR